MLIPKLFSKGVVYGTKPLFVPADASEEDMEKLRLQFEEELNGLTRAADQKCGLSEITVGVEKKRKSNGM
jgi:hypothetical protein